MKLSSKRQQEFLELLCHLGEAGFSLREAMAGARESVRDPVLAALYGTLLEGIQKGHSLGELLHGGDYGFNPLVLSLLQVAEEGGDSVRVLGHMCAYMEQTRRVREKISSALVYPALVLGAALCALVAIAVFVLPAFTEFARVLGSGAQERTAMLSMSMTVLSRGALALALCSIVGLPLYRFGLGRWAGLRRWHHRMLFTIPLLSVWMRLSLGRDFAFSMELLARAGLDPVRSLRTVRKAQSNLWVLHSLSVMEQGLAMGRPLSRLVAESGVFPPEAAQWMALGERSGRTADVFARMDRLCRFRLDRIVARVLVLAEPLMTLLMGLLMLGFVCVFVVPLLGMYGGMW